MEQNLDALKAGRQRNGSTHACAANRSWSNGHRSWYALWVIAPTILEEERATGQD